MASKGWRLSFSVMVMVVLLVLAIRWFGAPAPQGQMGDDGLQSAFDPMLTDVRPYFPAFEGMTYHFFGEGMEYATFTRQITFTAPGFLQVEDLSGTNLAQVMEYGEDEIKIVWSEEEFHANESLLEAELRKDRAAGGIKNLILLQGPLVKGHTWSDEGFRREIMAIDEAVTVPLGTFYDVVTVKSQSSTAADFVIYEYYAKNIGLIKRVSLHSQDEATYAVVSNLNSLACPPPYF